MDEPVPCDFSELKMQIAALYNEHFYLKQSERVNENEREIFGQLANVV